MIEEIGKVKLDYSEYSGEDIYSDGPVEDELLQIVKDLSPVEYAGVIEERKSWPILYHLSPLRENVVDWLPLKKSDKVLEVGSGCGAITGVFSRKAGSVTCVELSKKRSLINAYRHSECDNVTIHVGNFKQIEPKLEKDFDYICLIGVFEYGQAYIGGDKPYHDFLKILIPHLKASGRIIIAIENKYGMKYFAGCMEDHLGTYFSGIENYADGGGVRTFSRKGLEKIFHGKMPEYHFYYPYPDYKFMTTLYSDAYLPGRGELANNIRNFDRDRMVLFDEKRAFEGVVEDDLFPLFSNSYIAVLGEGFDIKYVKYSNDRSPEYAIKTVISRNSDNFVNVMKYPLGEAAKEHVRGMAVAYENLKEKYKGGDLRVNRCKLIEQGDEIYAQFEFIQGIPLTELMDRCLDKDDLEGFHKYFKEYVERIGYNSDYPVADFDLIFSNILVNKNTWTLIDYEWTFGKPIDTKELAFRAIYCYLLEDERRNKLNFDLIMNELQITMEDAENFRQQEHDFQKFVTGKHLAMAEIRDLIGKRMITPQKWINKYQDSEKVNRVQIYEDRGKGYSEEESYFVEEAYQGDDLIKLELKVDSDVKMLRIDPAMDSCIVKILEMTLNGETIPFSKKKIIVNGKTLKPGFYIFPTADPNINISLKKVKRSGESTLYTRMEVVRLTDNMAQDIAEGVKKIT